MQVATFDLAEFHAVAERLWPSQQDEHVKRFKWFQGLGGYEAYCADFACRRGYGYAQVQYEQGQRMMKETAHTGGNNGLA